MECIWTPIILFIQIDKTQWESYVIVFSDCFHFILQSLIVDGINFVLEPAI